MKTIIWAVDPFAATKQDGKLIREAAHALRSVAGASGAEIEPVFVFMNPFAEFEAAKLDRIERDLTRRGQRALDGALARLSISGLRRFNVVMSPSSNTRRAVDALVEHARDRHAELIVATTHARKGPARWFLGSFAETLATRSEIPLWLVPPQASAARAPKSILFATDFSRESAYAFSKVCALASASGAKIDVYHKLKYDLTPGVEVAFTAYPAYQRVFEAEVLDRRQEMARWIERARRAGVREVTGEVDSRMTGPVSESITKRARRGHDVIAMASQCGGGLSAALLGSTARQVLRSARTPIWLIRMPPKNARTEAGKRSKIYDLNEEEVIAQLNP